MTITPITPDHYPILTQWWETHGFPPPPLNALPTTGYLLTQQNIPTAATFLYLAANAPFALMEWTVANPANTPLTSARAIHHLAAHITTAHPTLHILTTCRQPALSRLYQTAGFIQTDTDMLHLLHPPTA